MGERGRPTKYDPIFVAKVEEYLSTTGREQTELPTKEGFAEFIDVDDDTLDNWADEKDKDGNLIRPDFFGALKRITSKQKNQLINDGLYGGKEVNPGMAIFLLKANHNMIETERKLVGNPDGSKLESLVVIKDGSTSNG
jgi:hypothetical protein